MSPRAPAMAPEERRRSIIDATLPLVVERRGEVSTREIAEAAGIAEGTIFRVFPDKDALWLAVAERTLNPETERAELAQALEGAEDLPTTIIQAADHLLERSQRVMSVMMLLRTIWMRQGGPGGGKPPPFIVEANKALMAGLTDLFEPYRAELSVDPQVAATVLRSLVLGQRHPGVHADGLLTPDEVAAVMLHGIMRAVR